MKKAGVWRGNKFLSPSPDLILQGMRVYLVTGALPSWLFDGAGPDTFGHSDM